MAYDPMEGPGGARRFIARWELRANLVAHSPLHLGAGQAGAYVDMALLRDRASKNPLLTGDSFAGAVRDHLCDRLCGDRVPESDDTADARLVASLFGGRRQDAKGAQSPLIVFDALADRSPANAVVPHETRDGVRIDGARGTAAEHGKYDLELWPRGTTFPVRVHLLVDEKLAPGDEARLLALLILATDGIGSGHVRIGAKGRRGFGRCKLQDVIARRFALDSAAAWRTWLRTGLSGIQAQPAPQTSLEAALHAAWPGGATAVRERIAEHRDRPAIRELTVDVPIRFKGGLLVGSPQTTPIGPDVHHLHSRDLATMQDTPVLSGTAIAGPLRHRALRIARQMHGDTSAIGWVDDLFGTVPAERGTPVARRRQLFASRLTVEERPLEDAAVLQVTRIRIDPFTQAPVETALIQEEPVFRGRATLGFRLRLPVSLEGAPALERAQTQARGDALCGLLLLLVKDLLLGDVPLGGTTAVGRGAIEPDQEMTRGVTVRRDGKEYTFRADAVPTADAREALESWVAAFARAAPLVVVAPEGGA